MYTLTELFFILVVALILGGLSFVLAAAVVMVKASVDSSILFAKRIQVQVAALGLDRQAGSS